MDVCTNCGRPRGSQINASSCVCIPASMWKLPQMVAALERLDIVAIIRVLRSHLLTRHLSQSALARLTGTSQATISMWESGKRSPDRRRAILVLQELGAPGTPGERSWQLPNESSPGSPEEPSQALRVVITAPVPIDVQVSPHSDDEPAPAASFVLHGEQPCLVVTPSSRWGITTSPSGVTSAWIALDSSTTSAS